MRRKQLSLVCALAAATVAGGAQAVSITPGDLVVVLFDDQARLVPKLLKRHQPVAHRILKKCRVPAGDAQNAQPTAAQSYGKMGGARLSH